MITDTHLSVHGYPLPSSPYILVLSVSSKPTVWISMSVCWSGNTNFSGAKHGYPYLYAANLSTLLWRNLTTHSVVIFVVHDDDDAGQGCQMV